LNANKSAGCETSFRPNNKDLVLTTCCNKCNRYAENLYFYKSWFSLRKLEKIKKSLFFKPVAIKKMLQAYVINAHGTN